MLTWLWKQKSRIDRGYQMMGLINLVLLLAQSERLSARLGVSLATIVVCGLPLVLGAVWAVGYILTLPVMQRAEDRSGADLSQVRRDLDEMLATIRRLGR